MRVTSRTVSRAAAAAFLASGILAAAHGVRAQVPDKFTNLKVLPKKISKDELVQTMRGYSFSLGVRCEHCHVPKQGAAEGQPKYDFASDEKATKWTARKMMKMMADINGKYMTKLEPKAKLKVECVTCHHGVPQPEQLASIMKRTVADSGATVAAARFETLRAAYYGEASYDFSETTLNTTAEGFLRAGKPADAVAMLELNAKHNPPSGWMQSLLGEAYLANGDRDKARAAYEKALEMNPQNQRVKKALESMDAKPN
jgi:peroxiredoxin family protein